MAGPGDDDEHDPILDDSIEAEVKTQTCVGGSGERDMAPSAPGPSIHRSGSRPQLDLSKAEIQGNFEERDPTILLPNQSDDISHLALDIGGMTLHLCFLLLLSEFFLSAVFETCKIFKFIWDRIFDKVAVFLTA